MTVLKINRRGSEYRKEQGRIEREFNALHPPQQNLYYHDKINGNSSYNQYIDNVSTIFKKHYSRIFEYKKNLLKYGIIQKNTILKVSFLIEDVSPLGSQAYDDNGIHPIILAFSKEFLELVRKSPDLDYVIACSSINSSKFIWLIIKESIEEYEQKFIDYRNMSFFDCTPQVMRYSLIIPNDGDNKQ